MGEKLRNRLGRELPSYTIALVGNPNVGKSTVFNHLTGMKQHTGNWSGKTVEAAEGTFDYKGKTYLVQDLPGMYSLAVHSEEERVAVDYLMEQHADCVLVVVDGTCLARNLNLVLQVLELTDRVCVCVNFMDEVEKKGLQLDLEQLYRELGIPVVGVAAGNGVGFPKLLETIRNLCDGFLITHPRRTLQTGLDMRNTWNRSASDSASRRLYQRAREISNAVVLSDSEHISAADRIVLGPITGKLLIVCLFFLIFWITVKGANIPSELLQMLFDRVQSFLKRLCRNWPWWLTGFLIDGAYTTAARVTAVMLPPMAIFFPLFTFLEDLGYLPRAAFLMDRPMEHCGSCGKQALTMAMGFGCNAVGVTGARIISSRKERLLAILTNALVPCNGRFPTLITLCALLYPNRSFLAAVMLTLLVAGSVGATMLVTKVVGGFLPSDGDGFFFLELPPYRKPRLGQILIRSFLDRTLFVLGRAAMVAAPAGALLWILQQININGSPLLQEAASFLNPVGLFLGMNGVLLLAFFLSFPANELLLPLVVMLQQGTTALSLQNGAIFAVAQTQEWTWKTMICISLFVLFHWPCSTTCLTIRKETGSWKWTFLAILLPTILGGFLCAWISHL